MCICGIHDLFDIITRFINCAVPHAVLVSHNITRRSPDRYIMRSTATGPRWASLGITREYYVPSVCVCLSCVIIICVAPCASTSAAAITKIKKLCVYKLKARQCVISLNYNVAECNVWIIDNEIVYHVLNSVWKADRKVWANR